MKIGIGIVCLGSVALLSGCEQKKNAFAAPPPPMVDVAEVEQKDIDVFRDFPARTSARARVEVRARVHGILEKQAYDDGAYVSLGDPLFSIESSEYEAAVNSAKAGLAQAQAELKLKATEYERKNQAFTQSRAVSELEVLSAKAQQSVAEAQVEVQQAALEDAERMLSYTKIDSPIAGRVGKPNVDTGSLVSDMEATLLTTIVQDDTLYVTFELNERDVLPYLERRPAKGEDHSPPDKELELVLTNNSVYPVKGKFDFIDPAVNESTGNLQVRAIFPNPERKLAAGLFVRIRIPTELEGALLVPDEAIQRDLGGSYVLILDEEGMVQRRSIQLSRYRSGEFRLVEAPPEGGEVAVDAVKAGERVIVSNLQRVRAGAPATLAPKGNTPAAPPSAAPGGAEEGEEIPPEDGGSRASAKSEEAPPAAVSTPPANEVKE